MLWTWLIRESVPERVNHPTNWASGFIQVNHMVGGWEMFTFEAVVFASDDRDGICGGSNKAAHCFIEWKGFSPISPSWA